jgi:beta-glucosidase-like glycosyl hydrolase
MHTWSLVINCESSRRRRYSVDFDLKKLVDESALDAKANRIEAKKQVKKVFEEKYKSQSVKTDRKAAGGSYFFNKLRF